MCRHLCKFLQDGNGVGVEIGWSLAKLTNHCMELTIAWKWKPSHLMLGAKARHLFIYLFICGWGSGVGCQSVSGGQRNSGSSLSTTSFVLVGLKFASFTLEFWEFFILGTHTLVWDLRVAVFLVRLWQNKNFVFRRLAVASSLMRCAFTFWVKFKNSFPSSRFQRFFSFVFF